jgi:hypothetical protein
LPQHTNQNESRNTEIILAVDYPTIHFGITLDPVAYPEEEAFLHLARLPLAC